MLASALLAVPAAATVGEISEAGADFRISSMGDTGDPEFDALNPAASIAYNASSNEYLAVWAGDDNVNGLVNDEFEIFAQRLDSTGATLGSQVRISGAGPNGDPSYEARNPAVAFSPTANEYLVVWEADDDANGLADDEFEIFGQRLKASGSQTGANDFRISDVGNMGYPNYDAGHAAVVYNPIAGEYLVVWDADDAGNGVVDNEREIFGQRLSATGAELGTNDFRISHMGPWEDSSFDAMNPAVAHRPAANEYLVVWESDYVGAVHNDEFEIFGQRLSASGAQIAPYDFPISDAGPNNDPNFDTANPAVAHNRPRTSIWWCGRLMTRGTGSSTTSTKSSASA